VGLLLLVRVYASSVNPELCAWRVSLLVEGYEGLQEMCYPYQVVLVEV
jgi:hypothetical protein